MAGLIDAATTSDDAESSEPHPDIFQAALAKVGPSPGMRSAAATLYDA